MLLFTMQIAHSTNERLAFICKWKYHEFGFQSKKEINKWFLFYEPEDYECDRKIKLMVRWMIKCILSETSLKIWTQTGSLSLWKQIKSFIYNRRKRKVNSERRKSSIHERFLFVGKTIYQNGKTVGPLFFSSKIVNYNQDFKYVLYHVFHMQN